MNKNHCYFFLCMEKYSVCAPHHLFRITQFTLQILVSNRWQSQFSKIHHYSNNVPIFILYFLHNTINCIFIRHFSKVNGQLPDTSGLQKKCSPFHNVHQIWTMRGQGEGIKHSLICGILHLSKVNEEGYNKKRCSISFLLPHSFLFMANN